MNRAPSLRIVSVNDVYLLDNLPRLKTLYQCLREEPARTLLVMAGDFVAPSILSSLDSGAGMVDCMNHVGFTHVVFGNHEDDIEPAQLAARVSELTAVVLGSNLPEFEPRLAAHDILEVEAEGRLVRVGLLGVVMDDLTVYNRAPFGGTRLENANDAARAKATELREQHGCDAVVALTHQPIPLDRQLAESSAPPLAAILGGHEHQVFVERAGSGSWIVKAGADAFRAAVTDLTWTAHGLHTSVRLEEVTAYAEDAELRTLVDAHMAKVHSLEAATLLRLEPGQELSSVGSREHQTSMGELLATRVRSCLGADLALLNGGSVRGNTRYTGRFSYGDLQREVPFANELVVVPLPGHVLQAALIASRAKAPSGGFLHVCDAVQAPEPSSMILQIGGEPFDPGRSYRVGLVRNFFSGMDDIQPLVAFAKQHPEEIPPTGSGRDIKLVLLESFAAGLWQKLGPFTALDRDEDGAVCLSELAESIANYTHDPDATIAAGIVRRVLDRDADGRISLVEGTPRSAPR